MNSINKQALDYLDKIDLNKVKIIAFDGNFDVNILKIEEAYDGHYSITYSWGDFSITEKGTFEKIPVPNWCILKIPEKVLPLWHEK